MAKKSNEYFIFLSGYILFGTLVYPFFGLLMFWFIPEQPHFLLERTIYAALCVAVVLLGSRYKKIASYTPVFAQVVGYTCALHFFSAMYRSNMSINYIAGSLIVLTALSVLFSSYRSLGGFLVYYLATSWVLCLVLKTDTVVTFTQISGVLFISLFVMYALYLRLQTQKLMQQISQQKEREMSESFARVSHDLKNPLILLTPQLNQISREQDLEKLRKKISGLASDHQVRSTVVMDMMKDIRLLSGLEAAKKSSQLDLKTTWDAACERVLGMQSILKFAGFQHLYSGDPLVVEMNKSDLERVLENLIKNAAEAMDRAGEISIQVEGISEGRAQVVVSNTESFIAPEILNELQNQGQVSTKAKGSGRWPTWWLSTRVRSLWRMRAGGFVSALICRWWFESKMRGKFLNNAK